MLKRTMLLGCGILALALLPGCPNYDDSGGSYDGNGYCIDFISVWIKLTSEDCTYDGGMTRGETRLCSFDVAHLGRGHAANRGQAARRRVPNYRLQRALLDSSAVARLAARQL